MYNPEIVNKLIEAWQTLGVTDPGSLDQRILKQLLLHKTNGLRAGSIPDSLRNEFQGKIQESFQFAKDALINHANTAAYVEAVAQFKELEQAREELKRSNTPISTQALMIRKQALTAARHSGSARQAPPGSNNGAGSTSQSQASNATSSGPDLRVDPNARSRTSNPSHSSINMDWIKAAWFINTRRRRFALGGAVLGAAAAFGFGGALLWGAVAGGAMGYFGRELNILGRHVISNSQDNPRSSSLFTSQANSRNSSQSIPQTNSRRNFMSGTAVPSSLVITTALAWNLVRRQIKAGLVLGALVGGYNGYNDGASPENIMKHAENSFGTTSKWMSKPYEWAIDKHNPALAFGGALYRISIEWPVDGGAFVGGIIGGGLGGGLKWIINSVNEKSTAQSNIDPSRSERYVARTCMANNLG